MIPDRLISRNAAVDALRYSELGCELEAIAALPSIDAVPVKHGWWFIGDDGALHCSECSETPVSRITVNGIQIFDMTPIEERMKYCPNCGAKMDGKEKTNDTQS